MKLSKKDIPYFAKIIGVLLIITMCTAALLSLVNMITKDKIAENNAAATSEAIGKIFSDIDTPYAEMIETKYKNDSFNAIYVVYNGEDKPTPHVGYYVDVTPKGFKGGVSMLVGLAIDGSVCGIQIVSHGETVGIGDKIEDKSFLDKFIGVDDNITYKKGADGTDGKVDGISGATYSSKAVIEGVNIAIEAYRSCVDGGAQ